LLLNYYLKKEEHRQSSGMHGEKKNTSTIKEAKAMKQLDLMERKTNIKEKNTDISRILWLKHLFITLIFTVILKTRPKRPISVSQKSNHCMTSSIK